MIHVDIDRWQQLVKDLIERVKDKGYKSVFGVPRGGIPIAAIVSERLNIPLLEEPELGTLVVDDIEDSGRTRKEYEAFDFEVLIKKETSEWFEFWYENTQMDEEALVTRMLETIGENPNREGLLDTPKRVTKMWKEIFRGYDPEQKPKIAIFENGSDGITYDQMVCDTGNFYSQCEHHMVPFMGQYWFAYVPDKKILGLSKVARIVDYYSAKLQIQERLVKEVLDAIEKELQPLGCALLMQGEHLCKTMRGVKKKGVMRTADLRGCLREPEARAEFMDFVNSQRG